MPNSQELIDRSVKLADDLQKLQDDLGVLEDVSTLKKRADSADTFRRLAIVAITGLFVFAGLSGLFYSNLRTLVHTECVRSEKGAELRNKLIDGLTRRVATPIPGSPPGLIATVKERNRQLDLERKDLLLVGGQIPKVKC